VYINTTESTGPALKTYQDKANSQEVRILSFMKNSQSGVITPSTAVKWIFKGNVPITSVRRAITELTNSGELVKTEAQTKGPYGHPERIWRLHDKHRQGRLF
jgi:predicted ArsR family transcriptional regulator